MTFLRIPHHRLQSQHLIGKKLNTAAEVVRWFGAMQAQDYLGALWAIGLRMHSATEKAVEQALAERTIVRTWPMRRTLHFVAAEDARWILKLLTPRTISRSRSLLRQLELDDLALAQCRQIFVSALSGGKQLSRAALYERLEANRIATNNTRGLHILCQLAQEGLICFGAREGKQQTFALLDEWLPPQKPKERNEALAELARRYFTSHGPATVQDFVWWSGLTVADATAGLELSKTNLTRQVIDGKNYWLASLTGRSNTAGSGAHLLPSFDEYTVAYRDRSAVLSPSISKRFGSAMAVLGPIIVIKGQAVGVWKRVFGKSSAVITANLYRALSQAEKQALRAAVGKYEAFLEQPVKLI